MWGWAPTPKYNSSDPAENAIKLGIEHGDSIPSLTPIEDVVEAIRQAGACVCVPGNQTQPPDPSPPLDL